MSWHLMSLWSQLFVSSLHLVNSGPVDSKTDPEAEDAFRRSHQLVSSAQDILLSSTLLSKYGHYRLWKDFRCQSDLKGVFYTLDVKTSSCSHFRWGACQHFQLSSCSEFSFKQGVNNTFQHCFTVKLQKCFVDSNHEHYQSRTEQISVYRTFYQQDSLLARVTRDFWEVQPKKNTTESYFQELPGNVSDFLFTVDFRWFQH